MKTGMMIPPDSIMCLKGKLNLSANPIFEKRGRLLYGLFEIDKLITVFNLRVIGSTSGSLITDTCNF